MATTLDTLAPRFWAKVSCGGHDECWDWLAGSRSDGYGGIKVDGKIVFAHRVAWTLAHGDIPDGMSVCHSCDNRACCNPAHLFLGTHQDNMDDMRLKGRWVKPRWEDHPSARLTTREVARIRERYATGGVTQRVLAREFGVTQMQIWRIVNDKSWTPHMRGKYAEAA